MAVAVAAPRLRSAARRRPTLLGGVVWIVALAVLLGGIVALNVAVLQLNVKLDRTAETRADLRATNDALSAQLSSVGSAPRVAFVANRQLGLVPATPERTTYVDLGRRRR
ncbi:MAG: hypothetical protein WD689_06720 [Gaiellaceae bacterium]